MICISDSVAKMKGCRKMKKRKIHAIVLTVLLITMIGTSFTYAQTTSVIASSATSVSVAYAQTTSMTASSGTSVSVPTKLKVGRVSDTSLKLTWKKTTGVSGYAVYQLSPGAKKYKKVETLAGSGKVTWTVKELKSNKVYKFKIRAYKNVSGKKKYSAYSYVVSATPYTKKAKKVNVKSIKVDYTKRYLGLKKVAKVIASTSVPDGKSPVNKNLTWTSSNPSIVTVTKYGWIQGKGVAGTAKVYIRAHNGATKTLTVTVNDYANPAQFTNLNEVKKWKPKTAAILEKYQDNMCNVAAYFEKYKKTFNVTYEGGEITFEWCAIYCPTIEEDLLLLLKDAGIVIEQYSGNLLFKMPDGGLLLYSDDNRAGTKKNGAIKIAPCWMFFNKAAVD